MTKVKIKYIYKSDIFKSFELPLDILENICKCDAEPPADSPKTVTLFTSPPKFAMLSCNHRKAIVWSFIPMFPRTDPSPVFKKPKLFSR